MKIYLETKRIMLRDFVPSDVDNLFDLDSDPDVMRFLTNGIPSTREYVQGSIERVLALHKKYNGVFGFWAAIEKSSDEFMGWFHFRPERHEPDNLKRIELGYRLKKPFWGKGFATEGGRALISKGFKELGINEVTAHTVKENFASRRVMEKCGLVFLREFNKEGAPDILNPHVEYVIAKHMWRI